MSKKIVITSGKGGVGKTTVAANLGLALAKSASVVVIDADIGLNNLDVVMGCEHQIVYDLGEVALQKCRLNQALLKVNGQENLCILPSCKLLSQDKIPTTVFNGIVSELEKSFDYILIDCPAGIEQGFHRAVSAANAALLVTTPHISAVRDADKVLSLLCTYNIKDIGLIVNRVRGDLSEAGKIMDAPSIAKLLKTPLRGAVPEDDTLCYGGIAQAGSGAGASFDMLAENIEGKTQAVFDCEKRYRNVFRKLFMR